MYNSQKYDHVPKSSSITPTRSTNDSSTESPFITTASTAASAATNDDTLDDTFGMKSSLQDLNRIDLVETATSQAPTQQEVCSCLGFFISFSLLMYIVSSLFHPQTA